MIHFEIRTVDHHDSLVGKYNDTARQLFQGIVKQRTVRRDSGFFKFNGTTQQCVIVRIVKPFAFLKLVGTAQTKDTKETKDIQEGEKSNKGIKEAST